LNHIFLQGFSKTILDPFLTKDTIVESPLQAQKQDHAKARTATCLAKKVVGEALGERRSSHLPWEHAKPYGPWETIA
jgi:hypothetical protein